MNRAAVLTSRDEVAIPIVRAPFQPFGPLLLFVRTKQSHGLAVEVDHASGVTLRRRLDDLVLNCHDCLSHRETRRIEIAMSPTQPEDLARDRMPVAGESPNGPRASRP
jgi:hypothetical protein